MMSHDFGVHLWNLEGFANFPSSISDVCFGD